MATYHSQIQAQVATLYYFHLPFCIAQVAILLFSFAFLYL